MSTIDEIMGAIGRHGDDCIRDADAASASFEALRELIAAALADARREGAEAMRAESAKLARALPLYYGSGDDGADESLAQAIEDLPIPAGERQAVLLTDREREMLIAGAMCNPGDGYVALAIATESAALAKNGMEVRRG